MAATSPVVAASAAALESQCLDAAGGHDFLPAGLRMFGTATPARSVPSGVGLAARLISALRPGHTFARICGAVSQVSCSDTGLIICILSSAMRFRGGRHATGM